jgi:hypothetical protein
MTGGSPSQGAGWPPAGGEVPWAPGLPEPLLRPERGDERCREGGRQHLDLFRVEALAIVDLLDVLLEDLVLGP